MHSSGEKEETGAGDLMGCHFSAAIGWLIGLGEDLKEEHAQTEIDN